MGGLVVPSFVLAIEAMNEGRHSPNGGGLFFAFVVGSLFVGAPLGGAVGLGYSIIPAVVAKTRKSPSHTDVDYIALSSGMWLMVVAGLHALVLMLAKHVPPEPEPSTSTDILVTLLWAVPFSFGALLLTMNAIRASQITRFIDRVKDGVKDEFRIVPRTRVQMTTTDPEVMPLMHGSSADECQSVLVRVGNPAREVLYRESALLPEAEDRIIALLP